MDRALERLAAGNGGEGGAAGPGPGGPQTVLGIFDLRGFTSANADWGFVRFLVDIFFLYYPKVWRCPAAAACLPVLPILFTCTARCTSFAHRAGAACLEHVYACKPARLGGPSSGPSV